MAETSCTRCNGSGYANAAKDSGRENLPVLLRPIGVYRCPTCDGSGKVGFSEELLALALAKINIPHK